MDVRCAVLPLLLVVSTPVSAQVQSRIVDLNTEALDAYQNLDIDTAANKLRQAISTAEQSGYAGPEVAQSFLNLGVVFVAGYGDLDQGLASFVSALCIQPDAQLDPLLSTPDVQQVFMQAQQDAQAGACGGAGPTPQQQYPQQPNLMPGPQPGPTVAGAMDAECPPGMVCDDGDGSSDDGPQEFARAFFNVQIVAGMALVQSGMPADSEPTMEQIFQAPTDRNMDGVIDIADTTEPVDRNGDGMIDEMDISPTTGQIEREPIELLRTDSPWVPDADSFDDHSRVTPVSTQCEADGIRTGPADKLDPQTNAPFTQLMPSSYCVRVPTEGFVTNMALRLNPGYWITDTFAVSLPFRLQFDSGEGSLSNILLGVRGELMFAAMEEATGFPISWFFGATYGQIQARPPAEDNSGEGPYVVSGPFGVHTGVNVRFRVHRNFGFIVGPEFDLQFPDVLINIDLSVGVEGAFL